MKARPWRILKMIWVTGGIAFTCWLIYSMQAHGVSASFLESSPTVTVADTDDVLSFKPVKSGNETLIFFPGALVDPVAYAPLCRQIADSGVSATIIKMPWRQATLGYKKVLELGLLNDKTQKYTLVGHSQGGKMAVRFVSEHPASISKLILLGTTHPIENLTSGWPGLILKIFCSKDGIAKPGDVIANKVFLNNTRYVQIEGGNHSQFGYYGFQLGDKSASISRETQQKIILQEILKFVHSQ